MILYVNGDSHTAAAQAVNNFCFANDDFSKVALGRKPHPDNLAVSWGTHLSKMLNLALICDAEAASSNERILRTTYDFLENVESKKYPYIIMVIGWTNWERTEWLDSNNNYIQVNPQFAPEEKEFKEKFKSYVRQVKYLDKQIEWHEKIWKLHQVLNNKKIPHLFFNANDSFEGIKAAPKKWNNCYLDPYLKKACYINWAKNNNFKCNDWYHYGPDAQLSWALHLSSWLTSKNICV